MTSRRPAFLMLYTGGRLCAVPGCIRRAAYEIVYVDADDRPHRFAARRCTHHTWPFIAPPRARVEPPVRHRCCAA